MLVSLALLQKSQKTLQFSYELWLLIYARIPWGINALARVKHLQQPWVMGSAYLLSICLYYSSEYSVKGSHHSKPQSFHHNVQNGRKQTFVEVYHPDDRIFLSINDDGSATHTSQRYLNSSKSNVTSKASEASFASSGYLFNYRYRNLRNFSVISLTNRKLATLASLTFAWQMISFRFKWKHFTWDTGSTYSSARSSLSLV